MGAAYDQCSGPAWMPGANFGTRNITFVPAPDRRLDDEAVVVAVDLAQPGVDVAEADRVARVGTVEDVAHPLRVGADAVVLDADLGVGAAVGGGDRQVAGALLVGEPVPHGVLDEGLHGEVGERHRQHLGRDEERDLQPVTEAGLLEHEVALDVAQLLGEGREGPARAQRVPREVGEVDEQLPGPVGVGAHERRDGRQAVVDEVGADLRAERPQLGLHDAGSRAGELGEGELARHPRGDLLGGAGEARGRVGRPRRERADDEVVHDEGGGHRALDRAVGVAADDVAAPVNDGAPRGARLRPEGEGETAVVLAGAGPRQDAAGVGDRDGPRAEDGQQVPPRTLGRLGREAVAEVLRGEGCRVQGRVGRPVDLGEEPAPSAATQQPDGRARGAASCRRRGPPSASGCCAWASP